MDTYETVMADVNRILAPVEDSNDSAAIESAYARAADLATKSATEQTDALSADRLQVYAKVLEGLEQSALCNVALRAEDFSEADRRHQEHLRSMRELSSLLQEKIRSGRSVAELGNDPKLVDALRDEFDAEYLTGRYQSDPKALQENARLIESKARSAIEGYEAIGDTADMGDGYLALATLYRLTGDVERFASATVKASDLYEKTAQTEEGADRAAMLFKAYSIRGAANLQLGSFDIMNARPDRRDALLEKAVSSFEQAASAARDRKDADGIADAEFQMQVARALRLTGEFQDALSKGAAERAAEKLDEAKRIIAPLDETKDPDNLRVARVLIVSLEADQHSSIALFASTRADWDTANISFARAFQLFEQLKSIGLPDEQPIFAAREAVIRVAQALSEGQQLATYYRFADAMRRFSDVPGIVDATFGVYRASLTSYQHGVLAKILGNLDIYLSLATATGAATEATLGAFTGTHERALALLDTAIARYRATGALAVTGSTPEQIYALCSNLENSAARFREFLNSIHSDTARLKLDMTANQEAQVGECVEIAVSLCNEADTGSASATCTVTTPAGCPIRHTSGLTGDGNVLTWTGVIAARENRKYSITIELPDKPGPYYVEAHCESQQVTESASLRINAALPTIRTNLGFMRVSLSEPQLNLLKSLGYVASLIVGAVAGVIAGKIWH